MRARLGALGAFLRTPSGTLTAGLTILALAAADYTLRRRFAHYPI